MEVDTSAGDGITASPLNVPNVSVMLTIYNRENEVILACLRALHRSTYGRANVQVVIVDDGTEYDTEIVETMLKARFKDSVFHRMAPYEAFRLKTNYNNPARAFNQALLLTKYRRLVVLGSDVLMTPGAFEKALKFDWGEIAYSPMILDLDSGVQYVGPQRLFPAPWMLCLDREHVMDVGGWDETYLGGMCYEDNDFMGRALARTERFTCDWHAIAYHVSHEQPVLNESDPRVREANLANKEYTRRKWNGVPFDAEFTPFDIVREPHPSGIHIHRVKCEQGKLRKAIEMTTGLVKDATREREAVREAFGV